MKYTIVVQFLDSIGNTMFLKQIPLIKPCFLDMPHGNGMFIRHSPCDLMEIYNSCALCLCTVPYIVNNVFGHASCFPCDYMYIQLVISIGLWTCKTIGLTPEGHGLSIWKSYGTMVYISIASCKSPDSVQRTF